MKKVLMLATFTIFVLGFVACGGDQVSDTNDVMEEFVNLYDSFATDLDDAGSATQVASALDNFTNGMEKLVPKMKELQKKYPNLMSQGKDEVPAEIKPHVDRLQNEIMPKFMSAIMKVSQYQTDPAVQEANKRFQEAMMKMGQ